MSRQCMPTSTVMHPESDQLIRATNLAMLLTLSQTVPTLVSHRRLADKVNHWRQNPVWEKHWKDLGSIRKFCIYSWKHHYKILNKLKSPEIDSLLWYEVQFIWLPSLSLATKMRCNLSLLKFIFEVRVFCLLISLECSDGQIIEDTSDFERVIFPSQSTVNESTYFGIHNCKSFRKLI